MLVLLRRNSHIALLIFGVVFASYQFSVCHYLKQQFFYSSSKFFEHNYIDPKNQHFEINKPKSLVLIYVESLENTYSNPAIFGRDLLSGLNVYKRQGTSFDKYQMMPGTEWTIASLVATQCGVPLKTVTVFGNNRQGEVITKFLSNAKCMGDILAEHGYKNVFMNGPSLKFAGVGQFFKDHHYESLYGKDEWLLKGYRLTDMSFWGLHDDDLFKEAKIKLAELIKENKLFNLTLLTIDTHGMDGYPSKACIARKDKRFPNTVECTADNVGKLISYIKEQGWLNKVNIVVLGDHLAMKNQVYTKLESSPSRTIYNLFLSNKPSSKNTNMVVGFDMLPTILESIGIKTKAGRVGLGYSAISTSAKRPAQSLSEMQNEIGSYSKTYNQLW